MIATLGKQGGRKYPQLRAAWCAHAPLRSTGTTAAVLNALAFLEYTAPARNPEYTSAQRNLDYNAPLPR